MNDSTVVSIAVQTMLVCAKVGGPILLVSLVLGFVVSLFQSVTQIQEMSLSFVPKLVGLAVVLVVSGSWMLGELESFTRHLFELIPDLVENS